MLLGVRVHHVTMSETVAIVRRLLTSGSCHQIVTINGAMLVRAARDERLRRVVNGASLTTADGVGVVLAGRILRRAPFERVAGVDLVDRLCALCAQNGCRVYLLGALPGVSDAAAKTLRVRHPGLNICGVQHGYFERSQEAGVIQRIGAERPHLLLVALGSPRQEEWIASHRESLGAAVCVGVGGTFDVLASRVRRAPYWMQRGGLEWAYRLLQEPWRWRVIATFPVLVWLALKERVADERKRLRDRGY